MTLPLLGEAAAEILALLVTLAAEEGVPLPERRYVAVGSPSAVAWDCDQVTVALQVLEPQQAFTFGVDQNVMAPADSSAFTFPNAVVGVQIVRCVPTLTEAGEPAPVGLHHTAGLTAMRDAALLRALAVRAAREPMARASAVRGGSVTPTGPDGGMAAVTLTLGVSVA